LSANALGIGGRILRVGLLRIFSAIVIAFEIVASIAGQGLSYCASLRAARIVAPNTGADFIRYLKGIKDSVTPEHLKLIEEVYGPDPLKPQSSIYGVGKHKLAET
jgi:hypothetical protein